MPLRYVVTSVKGFVQQIACCYLAHGYRWYVTGRIPLQKDPERVDRKLIEQYDLGLPRRTRSRRKELGLANVHYLRHEHFFVLLATSGRHRLFDDEGDRVRDLHQRPLKFRDYSISYRPGGRTRTGESDPRWHAHVQIAPEAYKVEKAYFLELALRKSVEELELEFRRVPFEPYAPVRRQLLNILRAVNVRRSRARLELVPISVLRLRRKIVKPFAVLTPPASSQVSQGPAQVLELSRRPEPVGQRDAEQGPLVDCQGNPLLPQATK